MQGLMLPRQLDVGPEEATDSGDVERDHTIERGYLLKEPGSGDPGSLGTYWVHGQPVSNSDGMR